MYCSVSLRYSSHNNRTSSKSRSALIHFSSSVTTGVSGDFDDDPSSLITFLIRTSVLPDFLFAWSFSSHSVTKFSNSSTTQPLGRGGEWNLPTLPRHYFVQRTSLRLPDCVLVASETCEVYHSTNLSTYVSLAVKVGLFFDGAASGV